MASTLTKKNNLIGIVALALLVSVGLNVYDHFITIPKIQATTNNMRIHAFNSWLNEMIATAYVLKKAVTLDEFHQAEICLRRAEPSVAALLAGIDPGTTSLYYWINRATDSLTYTVQQIEFLIAEALKYVNPSPLDQHIMSKIENITVAINDLSDSLTPQILDPWTHIEADLILYLQDEGKLTDIVNYCKQIHENSIDITDYVRDKLY